MNAWLLLLVLVAGCTVDCSCTATGFRVSEPLTNTDVKVCADFCRGIR